LQEAVERAALAGRLDAVDHVRPGLGQPGGERRQQLGRLLEVAVDQEHPVAGRPGQPGHDRRVVAEVPRQVHHPDVPVLPPQVEGDGQGVVRRAVVDEHELDVGGHAGGGGRGPRVELPQVRGRPEQGRDDAQPHGAPPRFRGHRRTRMVNSYSP
jgi:hypothetical protein